MRKNNISFLSLFILLSYSCSESTEHEGQPLDNNVTHIVATIEESLSDDGVQTRTTFDNDKSIFVWAKTDTIGIFPNTGDQVSFPIEGEAGKTTIEFNGGGWGLKTDATYYAYFPFDRKNYWGYNAKNSIRISFLGQKQKGKNNADFAATYPFVSYGVNKNGNVHFSFKHLASHGVFTIKSPTPAIFTKAVLTTEDGGDYFIQEGTYDLTQTTATVVPTIKASSYGPSIEMVLQNVSTTSNNESFLIFMTIPPTNTLSSRVVLNLTDSYGNLYYAYPSNPSNPNNDGISKFNAGSRYRRTFVLEKSENAGDGNENFVFYTEKDEFNSEEDSSINVN